MQLSDFIQSTLIRHRADPARVASEILNELCNGHDFYVSPADLAALRSVARELLDRSVVGVEPGAGEGTGPSFDVSASGSDCVQY